MSQELFLIVGGELEDVSGVVFRDPTALHIVGIYTNRDAAVSDWRGHAQRTVDNALMRYFILPLGPALHANEITKA